MSRVTLAHPYKEERLHYPVVVQPKLDGIRCRAVIKDHVCTLWTRENNAILSMDHIIKELEVLDDIELDGELYTHGLAFETLGGIVRRQYHDQDSLQLEYHVYDYIPTQLTDSYNTRYLHLEVTFAGHQWNSVSLLKGSIAVSRVQLVQAHGAYLTMGYEGTMIRTQVFDRKLKTWSDPGYQSKELTGHRRSYALLKMKDFLDAEFLITGIAEEVSIAGVPKGRVGAFILTTSDCKVFQASGISDATKEDAWSNPEKYIGQYATIKYFGTSPDGVPRFPNYVSIRWDVDPTSTDTIE